jgi:outer membrane usher protein
VGYYYTQSADHDQADSAWSFNLNIPLGGPLADSSLSYSTTSDNNGHTSQQVSMYGSVPHRPHLYYSVQQGYANAGQGSNSSAALDYHGGYGSAQLGYRHDRVSHQLTWGPPARSRIPRRDIRPTGWRQLYRPRAGAANVAIQNGSNIHTDGRGYAVVPTLTVYRKIP